MSMSMRVRVRVRMRTACRMHSIARNAAWHGSRAQRERLITIRKHARAHTLRRGMQQTYANIRKCMHKTKPPRSAWKPLKQCTVNAAGFSQSGSQAGRVFEWGSWGLSGVDARSRGRSAHFVAALRSLGLS